MTTFEKLSNLYKFSPSFLLAKERVVERSKDRVSKYTSDININAWRTVYSPRMRYAVRPSLRQAGKRVKTAIFSEGKIFFHPPFCLQKGRWSSEATTGRVNYRSDISANGPAHSLLTPNALRFSTLSPASRKEGEDGGFP